MRLRQIAYAASDLRRASAELAQLLGLDPPYRDPGVAKFGLDNAVYVFGDQFIEIVSPVQPGTTGGRHIERRGDSGYMLLLQTDDLARERQRFKTLGLREIFDAQHDDIRAVHLHPKDVGGAIVSVDEPRPAASWRWGGPDGRPQPGRRGDQRIVGVTVEAVDPQAMAARWASVFGVAEPSAQGGGWRLQLHGATLDFVRGAARGDGIAGFALALADRPAVLDAARSLGLPVGSPVGRK
jgi:hypothetical protein